MSPLARRAVTSLSLVAGLLGACGGRTDVLLAGALSGPDAGPGLDAGLGPDVVAPGPVRDASDRDALATLDATEAAGACCGDEQNTDYPTDTNCSGTTIAWQYVPSCDFAVARIELHKTGGTVALLDSAPGGEPGATIWQGDLPSSPTGEPAWNGADVVPPIPLVAGHVYYLEESPGTCSIAKSGVPYTYYGLQGDGSWSGPWQQHAWTSHVIGTCH